MTPPDAPEPWAPRRPALIAGLIFVAAALTLCWPMLAGQFLTGSDQYLAGYAFRSFAADHFREHGSIPLWNPYLFGGLPFVAAMHGDVFYPTAWLRWVLPVDVAMNLGFAVHIVLAGIAMYALLRGLGRSWAGAVTGGIAYELTGIVAGLVHPGHDGKLFVSALAPLLLLALLRAIRTGRPGSYGAAALVIGLSLHGHPQLSYYLLVAAGLWTLFLVFGDPAGPQGRRWYAPLGAAVGAVVLGFGLYAVQALPFIEYLPFSARGAGAGSGAWEYATAYSMPPDELMSAVLPEFNGVGNHYWGRNFFKLHTEYIGALPLALGAWGIGGHEERRSRLALAGIGVLFLLVSLGGHTPFYRLWYELVPMMNKARAPGSAFYLVALPVVAYAGFGADRLFRGQVPIRRLAVTLGVLGGIALLGVAGVLQGIAEALAAEQQMSTVIQNADALRVGALRLLAIVLLGGGILYAVGQRRLRGAGAVAAVGVAVVADLYSVERRFFDFQGTAAQLFGDDEITTRLRQTPAPYRVWEPKGERFGGLAPYPGAWLMGRKVPTLFGYHGNELRDFDELLGGKNLWLNQLNPVIQDLFAVRYVLLRQPQELPGYHLVLGPVPTTTGGPGVLYEADSTPPYVRLMAGAVKAPDSLAVDIVNEPRFPARTVAVFADTASVTPTDLGGREPDPPLVTASVTAWEPGRIEVGLRGSDTRELYLVVAENWYAGWTATVDRQAVPVHRAHHTLLSTVVPPGAQEVVFEFTALAYRRGKMISLFTLALVLGLMAAPAARLRRSARG